MHQVTSKGIVLIVTILCITGMALPAAAGSGSSPGVETRTQNPKSSTGFEAGIQSLSDTNSAESELSNNGEQVTEHVYLNLDSKEIYRFGGTPDLSELPDGTYLETRTIKTKSETHEQTRRVKISNGQLSELATNSDYQLAVRHNHSEYDASYEAGSTIDLWVAAANQTAPVSNFDVTVTIRAPDGTEETFNETIGSDGSTTLSYDTTGKDPGQYDIFVESPNGRTVWDEFIIGPQIKEIYPSLGDSTTVGSEVTAAVLLTEDASPIANTETSVTIRAPDGTEETRSVTTDEDGFALLNFTASQEGAYIIDADNFHEHFRITAGTFTAETRVNGEKYGSEARPGTTFNFAGQLQDGTGAAENVPVTIQMVRDPYGDEEVVKNYSATTDSTGLFYIEGQIPSDANDGTEYEFQYSTDSNAKIAGYVPDLRVETAGDGSTPTDTLEVDIEPDQEFAIPGETIELAVSATSGDSQSAYANEEITILPSVEYGNHPVDSITVQTNESGQATTTYTVPELPDGTRLEFGAKADFNGNVYVGSFNEISVQQYAIQDGWENPSNPGGEATYKFSVTNVKTGDPVANFPLMLAAERSEGHASVYATDTLRTNSSGSAQTTVTVPADASGENHFGTFARYESSSSFPVIEIPTFDAQITGLGSYEYAAGETLTLTYDGPTGTSAVVAVRSYSSTAPTPIKTARLDAGEQFTFTIPSDAPQGTYYSIEGFATNTDGQISKFPYDGFRVEGSTGNLAPTAAFTYTPSEPTVSDSIAFDASGSVDDDGSITSYEWDFNGDGTVDATGETATYQYDTAATYDAMLTVTDDSGATDSVTKSISVTESTGEGVTISFDPESVSLTPSGTSSVDVVIEGASDIGAYDFNLSLTGSSDADISDVTLKGNPGVQDSSIADDNQSASASAALASIDGNGNATIATVELTGNNPGAASLGVAINALGDESGIEYNISDGTATASVTIQAGPGDVTDNGNAATDPDGDGVYEDVNGDGSVNVLDVQSLFGNLGSDKVSGNAAFDINDDGDTNILDVQALFAQL